MKNYKYIVLLILCFGCKNTTTDHGGNGYLKDSTLTDFYGLLIDSSIYYLPTKYYNDSIWQDSKIDSFCLKWFSSNYSCFKSPILYNYYLGYENYRFLWIRNFHKPVLITIRKKNKIEINTKFLNGHPDFFVKVYLPKINNQKPDDTIFATDFFTTLDIEDAKKRYPNADSILPPRNDIKIDFDTTYYLSNRQWNYFIKYIDSCNFWKMNPYKDEIGIDGAMWVLEGQNRDKYHFVVRFCPDEKFFRNCCLYLIKLSAAKNEKIY